MQKKILLRNNLVITLQSQFHSTHVIYTRHRFQTPPREATRNGSEMRIERRLRWRIVSGGGCSGDMEMNIVDDLEQRWEHDLDLLFFLPVASVTSPLLMSFVSERDIRSYRRERKTQIRRSDGERTQKMREGSGFGVVLPLKIRNRTRAFVDEKDWLHHFLVSWWGWVSRFGVEIVVAGATVVFHRREKSAWRKDIKLTRARDCR